MADPEKGMAGLVVRLGVAIKEEFAKATGGRMSNAMAKELAAKNITAVGAGDAEAEAYIRTLLPDLGMKRAADLADEQEWTAFDKSNTDHVEARKRRADADQDYEKEWAKLTRENKAHVAKRKADQKDTDRDGRRMQEAELSGRMKWVEHLQREQQKAVPKIHGDAMSAINALRTAGRGKDPQLERIEQILEMQLDALKQSAQVGP
jgi:hypothetical protein